MKLKKITEKREYYEISLEELSEKLGIELKKNQYLTVQQILGSDNNYIIEIEEGFEDENFEEEDFKV